MVAQAVLIQFASSLPSCSFLEASLVFLPVLGLWMLPLGLLFIAQDVPILQKPLVSALAWVEAKWEQLKVKWRNR